jgi:hypothetical protein
MCMLDCAGYPGMANVFSNDLFRFSTTLSWEQLDATVDAGLQPRSQHSMVSVGSDVYVFGGTGEEGLCDDGHRLGACQIERLGDAPRAAAVLVATCCARAGCHTGSGDA